MALRVELDEPERILLPHPVVHLGDFDDDMLDAESLDDRRVGHIAVMGVISSMSLRGPDDALRGHPLAK